MKQLLTYSFLLLFTINCFAQDFWVPLEVPGNTGVYIVKGNTSGDVFLGANGIFKSIDNGVNWTPTTFTNLAGTIDINLQNGDIFTGNQLGVFYSNDNGNNWNTTVYQENANTIFLSSNNDLFIGYWGGIFKLDYSGGFGEEVLFLLNNTMVIKSIVENVDGVLFAGVTAYMGGGGVYSSFNNGNTWEYCGLNNKYISSLSVNSNGVIFAGSRGDYEWSYGGVYMSANFGSTWEELRSDILVTSIAISPNNEIFIGCSALDGFQGGVFRSVTNGETWELINSGMTGTPDVEGLTLSPDGYLYAYGSHLYRSVNPIFTSITQNVIDSESIQVYPNPFSQNVTIQLPKSILNTQNVVLEIYSIMGVMVWQNTLPFQQSFTVNLLELKPGTYILSAQINRMQFSKRIVKISN